MIAKLSIRKLGKLLSIIISTDEDPSLHIDSFAMLNLLSVSAKLYFR